MCDDIAGHKREYLSTFSETSTANTSNDNCRVQADFITFCRTLKSCLALPLCPPYPGGRQTAYNWDGTSTAMFFGANGFIFYFFPFHFALFFFFVLFNHSAIVVLLQQR